MPLPRRVAIIDLGSNTFRMVTFSFRPGGPFHPTDEIRDTVRLSAGASDGKLSDAAISRGLAAVRMYVAYCRRTGVDEILVGATSAIRDAANQDAVCKLFAAAGLPVRVLSATDEAYYAYLGIANSMEATDGYFLDVGGGSVQIGRIVGRRLEHSMSAPLGAVRMSERFYDDGPAGRSQIKAQRKHVSRVLLDNDWLEDAALPVYGTGGTIRTLAAMAARAANYPLNDVHAFTLQADDLSDLIDTLAALPARSRGKIAGLKSDRADIILAGAITVQTVLATLGADRVEVCGEGLREGMFYEHYLRPLTPPLIADVRTTTVENMAGNYGVDRTHADHVARLATDIFDGTAAIGLHDGCAREREWLWAASTLHDIGVLVDYHDHHKHGFYLVLNSGMPGFSQRELAIIALLVRAHRKSVPNHQWLAPVLEVGDEDRFLRLASCLRIAEQLERDRTQQVESISVSADGDVVSLHLNGEADHSVALWSAEPEAQVFERAFGRPVELSA